MRDNDKIELDDLILFFRGLDDHDNETIVNRWIPHDYYTNEARRVAVKPGWQDAVLSEPSLGKQGKHYYVANLARLVPPDETRAAKKSRAKAPAHSKSEPGPGDLIVFPPEDPDSCFQVTRAEYEECQALSPTEIPDLEFMAREEGAVLANVPKVTPQGCTCILLSLVSLRSGMLKGYENKTDHAHRVRDAIHRGHTAHKR